MDILELLRTRYTTKHYSGRRISREDFEDLLEAVRLAPSSVNSQPWRVFTASTPAGVERIRPAVMPFNTDRINGASDVIVFAVPEKLEDEDFRRVLEKEKADGRFAEEEFAVAEDQKRRGWAASQSKTPESALRWESKQVFLALGCLLIAAASKGIDSTTLEGVDFDRMDEILGLREKRMRSVVAVSLGYRSPDDANAKRPKSRLAKEDIIFPVE